MKIKIFGDSEVCTSLITCNLDTWKFEYSEIRVFEDSGNLNIGKVETL